MNFLRTFLTSAALTLASTAALAEAPVTRSFERDGVTYEYTATQKGGVTILRGTADGRAPFKLVVANKKVRGTVDGKYVSFARPATGTTAIAAR